MKRIHLILLASLLLTIPAAVAADYLVIANPSVTETTVSSSELKDVFLGAKKSLADGSSVTPVLGRSGAAHEAFLKECIGKTDSALRNHFKSLVFTGKGSMPKSFDSDAEVISYVADTKGAVGYVSPSASPAGVKKLTVK